MQLHSHLSEVVSVLLSTAKVLLRLFLPVMAKWTLPDTGAEFAKKRCDGEMDTA